MKHWRATVRSSVGAVVLLLLTACSAAVVSPPTTEAPLAEFHVSARVTVRPEAGAVRRFPILWRRVAAADGQATDDIRIRHPLGGVVGRIERTPTEAVLTWRGETIRAANAALLAKRLLGHPVPVDALGHWLQGRPAPHGDVAERVVDTAQRLREIHQDGWRVHYRQYNEQGLPTDILLVTPSARIDVHIRKWLITP